MLRFLSFFVDSHHSLIFFFLLIVVAAPSLIRQQSVADTGVRSRDEAPKLVPLVISRSESFSASGAITSCKFSPDGTYMACGTVAGNVRIWPLSMQAAKNSATIYGSSEILSLEWETKTGKLVREASEHLFLPLTVVSCFCLSPVAPMWYWRCQN
jgi:WD40 repeat protein